MLLLFVMFHDFLFFSKTPNTKMMNQKQLYIFFHKLIFKNIF